MGGKWKLGFKMIAYVNTRESCALSSHSAWMKMNCISWSTTANTFNEIVYFLVLYTSLFSAIVHANIFVPSIARTHPYNLWMISIMILKVLYFHNKLLKENLEERRAVYLKERVTVRIVQNTIMCSILIACLHVTIPKNVQHSTHFLNMMTHFLCWSLEPFS